MAVDPLRQRGQNRSSVRSDPAFAQVAGGACRNHQILHQERLITLEARSLRNLGIDHSILDADARRHLAAEPPLARLAQLRRLGAFVHAAWFDGRPAFQAFEPGDLLALRTDDRLQRSDLAEHLNQQSLKLCAAQIGQAGRRRHLRKESHRVEPAQAQNRAAPGVLPLLPTQLAKKYPSTHYRWRASRDSSLGCEAFRARHRWY